MGRITIFTDRGIESERVISALNQYAIPFVKIDLYENPGRRRDMISLTNDCTTPQVFINEQHIKGGANGLINVLQKWKEEAKWGGYETLLERFEIEIEDADTLCTDDPRLRYESDPNLTSEYIAKIATLRNLLALPDGSMVPKGNVMRQLIASLPRQTITINKTRYENCCFGSDVIETLMILYNVANTYDAIQFSFELQKNRILYSVSQQQDSGHHNALGEDSLYRLHQFHNNPKQVLNYLFIWSTNPIYEKPHPMQTILKISKMVDDIVLLSLNYDKTSNINSQQEGQPTTNIYDHALYHQFEDAICQLQMISFDEIENDKYRLAFGLNLYNIMIRHYVLETQRRHQSPPWPTKARQIPRFLSNICYNVGGKVVSAQELSQKLLLISNINSNECCAYGQQSNIKRWFSRISCSRRDGGKNGNDNDFNTSDGDLRLHFAMSLGTKDSPIVRTYHPKSLDAELQMAVQEYCACHINISEVSGVVTLPRLFLQLWNRKTNNNDLMAMLVDFMTPLQLATLERTTQGSKQVKVVYHDFDWQPSLFPEGPPPLQPHDHLRYHHNEREQQEHLWQTQKQVPCDIKVGNIHTNRKPEYADKPHIPVRVHSKVRRRSEELYDDYATLTSPSRLPKGADYDMILPSKCASTFDSSTASPSLSSSPQLLQKASSSMSVQYSFTDDTLTYNADDTTTVTELRDIFSEATKMIFNEDAIGDDDWTLYDQHSFSDSVTYIA